MLNNRSPHLTATLQALFVTFLWATSWVLIKLGLHDIPALTFAGLRYLLAFLCLLPFGLLGGHLAVLRSLPRRDWLRLVALGLLYIAITQGAQFLGLSYLPCRHCQLAVQPHATRCGSAGHHLSIRTAHVAAVDRGGPVLRRYADLFLAC